MQNIPTNFNEKPQERYKFHSKDNSARKLNLGPQINPFSTAKKQKKSFGSSII